MMTINIHILKKNSSQFSTSVLFLILLCINLKGGPFEDFVEFTNFKIQGLFIASKFLLSINLGFGFKVLYFWFLPSFHAYKCPIILNTSFFFVWLSPRNSTYTYQVSFL
jgi:hypothetical protein